MKFHKIQKKKFIIRILILLLVTAAVFLLVKNNYGFYQRTIGTVTAVESIQTDSKKGFDGKDEYEERYYLQRLTIKIRNGLYDGQTLSSEHRCTSSGVYDITYKEGDDVFVEKIEADENGKLHGNVTETKRDYIVALISTLLFGLFLLITGREGTMTVISLLLNIGAFYMVLKLYLNGCNILFLTVPMVIFFVAMLLFFMHGNNQKTWVALTAVLLTTCLTTCIAALVLKCSTVDYEFMEYLIQPYDPADAAQIFLAELLIGSVGAIMDVVVTITVTVDQIMLHNPQTKKTSLWKSCKRVGDDVVGTMLGIMFFTNVAASMPFIMLCMRNGFSFLTILRYHSFFELARFLTGSIGIVLSIPIASMVAVTYYHRRTKREAVKSC